MKYIRMRQVEVVPMTHGDYNEFKGFELPANKNPSDEGYKVTYSDGYRKVARKHNALAFG